MVRRTTLSKQRNSFFIVPIQCDVFFATSETGDGITFITHFQKLVFFGSNIIAGDKKTSQYYCGDQGNKFSIHDSVPFRESRI
jgi:hypothetical protein